MNVDTTIPNITFEYYEWHAPNAVWDWILSVRSGAAPLMLYLPDFSTFAVGQRSLYECILTIMTGVTRVYYSKIIGAGAA